MRDDLWGCPQLFLRFYELEPRVAVSVVHGPGSWATCPMSREVMGGDAAWAAACPRSIDCFTN